MSGIPPELSQRLRNILLRCDYFDTDANLKAIFTDSRIYAWRDGVSANNRNERVNKVIASLMDQHDPQGQNALLLFLQVLSETTRSDDTYRYKLRSLADELEKVFTLDAEELITIAAKRQDLILDLSNRGLTELPDNLFQLKYLERLDLSRNALTMIPPEIVDLSKLCYLDLSQNRLTSLPPEMRHLPLETLDVRGNSLPIPEELLRLPSNKSLGLSSALLNKLQSALLRTSIFANDQELMSVFVDARLSLWRYELPEASSPSIRVRLTIDFLHNRNNAQGENALVLLLQVLAELYSPEDTLCRELRDLANELSYVISPMTGVQLVEPSVIFNYLFPSNQRSLNEVKLLLVGEGGVGKTSLVKRLMNQEYDPHESMTEGILVEHWYLSSDNDSEAKRPLMLQSGGRRENTKKFNLFNVFSKKTSSQKDEHVMPDESLRLNIWDFGGQEIMHATHQFFLTRRSLYLVVIEARTGERGLDYWLQIVRSYGGDSPIIVVINKDDVRHIELNEVALKAKYPNICAFIPTSCADETHPGIVELRQAILDQVAQMPHVRTEWPGPWFEVKTRLEQMERDYITYDEYAAICAEMSIADTDIHTLVTFLHDLGIILNYHEDIRLQETNVLKPEWVTQAVYSIINARQIVENTGILRVAQLRDILPDRKCYPYHKHGFILDLMRKFELSFVLDENHTRFLIPDLLPKNEILLEGWPPPEENLIFQYRYSVLPGSIITRFIVQMHTHIYHGIVWRTGVCLRYQSNLALIKADEAAECLTIQIIGNFHTRREFLAIIRERLQAIHASFKDLTISEYIAIPGHPNVFANYTDLLIHEQLGERRFIPSGLNQRFSIAAILDSVIAPEERGAIFGISEELLTRLQQTLAMTGFCDDIVDLRNQLRDSPVALWINELREATDALTQAYEIIRHFHGRRTTNGDNGLDLFLQWLIPQLSQASPQRATLISLSSQLIAERNAYHAAPPVPDSTGVTYNITVKEGGQVAAIGNHSNIKGGAHFGD